MRAPWCKTGAGRRDHSIQAGTRVSRRSLVASGPALLAACGTDPDPRPAPAVARRAVTELDRLQDGATDLVVAGEPLNADTLRRFYQRRDFQPVWSAHRAQANRLVEAVLRAGDHGLDPAQYRAGLLRRQETFPPLRRELLLTDAFLSYADALAHGAVSADRRKDFEALTGGRVDVAATLDAAIRAPDAAAAIEALAPTTPSYRVLREALARHRAPAPARGRAPANRLREIEVNLERERWLPRALPADRVWVNVADQSLVAYLDHEPALTSRVIVGETVERKQSPEFHTRIEAGFFNPPWIVPRDIVEADILPRLAREPDYLERRGMVLRANGEIEQEPGPEAGLGVIMFDMPNRFDVYLHDTPDKQAFNRDNRRISNGCIRVQKPLELAALLLRRPLESVEAGIAEGGTTRHRLPTPMPVFLTYQTAFADAGGALQFRPDFYNRDADLWQRLKAGPATA